MTRQTLIPQHEVYAMLGIGRSTLYRIRNRGDFPRPYRIGPRRIGYSLADITQWLEQQRE